MTENSGLFEDVGYGCGPLEFAPAASTVRSNDLDEEANIDVDVCADADADTGTGVDVLPNNEDTGLLDAP